VDRFLFFPRIPFWMSSCGALHSRMELHRLNFLAAAVRSGLNPISPIANPCCNATLKIGVVLSL
jgi:hypothetical protein